MAALRRQFRWGVGNETHGSSSLLCVEALLKNAAGLGGRMPVSEPQDLANRAGNLVELRRAVALRTTRRANNAVAQVVVEQAHGDLLKSPRDRGDLDDDIRAPAVLLDHLL